MWLIITLFILVHGFVAYRQWTLEQRYDDHLDFLVDQIAILNGIVRTKGKPGRPKGSTNKPK